MVVMVVVVVVIVVLVVEVTVMVDVLVVYVGVQATKGQGVRHVVYWRHSTDPGLQVQPLKVNLILYENDVLQVGLRSSPLTQLPALSLTKIV